MNHNQIADAAARRWHADGRKNMKSAILQELDARGITEPGQRDEALRKIASILGKRGTKKRWPEFPPDEQLADEVSELMNEGKVMPHACAIVFKRHGINKRNRAYQEHLHSTIGSILAKRKKAPPRQDTLFELRPFVQLEDF